MPAYRDEVRKTWYCSFHYSNRAGENFRKLKRGFETKKAALEWERQFLQEQSEGVDMSMDRLADHYFEDRANKLRPSSVLNKKSMLKRITTFFAGKSIGDITPRDVLVFLNQVDQEDLSESYKRDINRFLNILFNHAIRYYGLKENPCLPVDTIGESTKSTKFWTLDEFKTFIASVDKELYKTLFTVLFYSGMRIGECLALTKVDLDFTANTITIDKSLFGDTIGPPKTKNGFRTITMPLKVMQELQAYCGKLYGLKDHQWIFQVTKPSVNRNLTKFARQADVPVIRVHDLRHSHVSLLIRQGFSTKVIADRIGDSETMVVQVYGHLYPDSRKEVANCLDNLV